MQHDEQRDLEIQRLQAQVDKLQAQERSLVIKRKIFPFVLLAGAILVAILVFGGLKF